MEHNAQIVEKSTKILDKLNLNPAGWVLGLILGFVALLFLAPILAVLLLWRILVSLKNRKL